MSADTVPGDTHVPFPIDEDRSARRTALALDVVIPVYNEEVDLRPAVARLHDYLTTRVPLTFRITIADNASTDRTAAIADELAEQYPGVRSVHLVGKGRGRALKAVWTASDASVLAYMDVDLSTDLDALLPLVAPLISGHSDIAIGTRLHRGARVVRGSKREFISRCYNLILRGALAAHFSDAQCGFKAIRAEVARQLLPLVQDTGWFFDTELLILAERSGLRIHEVPVDWVDDPDSRVDIVSTAKADLQGVARVGRALATGALPLVDVRRQIGPGRPGAGDARGAGRHDQAGRQIRRDRGLEHAGLSGVVRPVARGGGCPGGEFPGPRPDRHRQHRSKPPTHLWHPGPHGRCPASVPGFRNFPGGPDDHQWIACTAASFKSAAEQSDRDRCAHRGEPGGHRGAIRPTPGLGLPALRCCARQPPVRCSAVTRTAASATAIEGKHIMTPLLADQRGGGTLPPPTIAPADAVPPTGLSGGSG